MPTTLNRNHHPDVPWRLMAGFRDVLIHGYEGVDLARVWLAASRDLPEVEQALLTNKKAAGRPQDVADASWLESVKPES